jgi:hypothetical protein
VRLDGGGGDPGDHMEPAHFEESVIDGATCWRRRSSRPHGPRFFVGCPPGHASAQRSPLSGAERHRCSSHSRTCREVDIPTQLLSDNAKEFIKPGTELQKVASHYKIKTRSTELHKQNKSLKGRLAKYANDGCTSGKRLWHTLGYGIMRSNGSVQ